MIRMLLMVGLTLASLGSVPERGFSIAPARSSDFDPFAVATSMPSAPLLYSGAHFPLFYGLRSWTPDLAAPREPKSRAPYGPSNPPASGVLRYRGFSDKKR
jgi:hypothetical protein